MVALRLHTDVRSSQTPRTLRAPVSTRAGSCYTIAIRYGTSAERHSQLTNSEKRSKRCRSESRQRGLVACASKTTSMLPAAASRLNERAFEFLRRGEKNRSCASHRIQIE